MTIFVSCNSQDAPVKKVATKAKASVKKVVDTKGPWSKINKDQMVNLIANAKYDKDMTAMIQTDKGTISLDLYATKTPKLVASFVNLAKAGYYDGLDFHRVVDDYIVQAGCPRGDGNGDPGYYVEDQFGIGLSHNEAGAVAMVNNNRPNTNNSQFYITTVAAPDLNGKFCVFGKLKGSDDLAIVKKITKGTKIKSINIYE